MPGYAQVQAMFPPPAESSYAWMITRDVLFNDKSAVGVIGPYNATDQQVADLKAGKGVAFRLLDDDGEIYFHGRFLGDPESEDGFGPLDDYGGPDSGCTEIQYYQDHHWVTL